MRAPDVLGGELFDKNDEDSQKDKYLTCRLGNEDYGLEIRHVNGIVSIQKITEIPDTPDFVEGVIQPFRSWMFA